MSTNTEKTAAGHGSESAVLENVVALAKRRGFVYQGSEIYGGLAGTWDWGPLGVELKRNIREHWWRHFVQTPPAEFGDMFGVDAALLMNQKVWQASGHVAGFADPLVVCKKCGHRFRADQIPEDKKGTHETCPDCGGKLGPARQFNMMFKTQIGASEDDSAVSYLRPETAQGMFVNFKNILDSFHPRLPFGMGQIGKAFRNEIAPRDFLFRTREFEQMEVEYFVRESEWETHFENWRKAMRAWMEAIGLDMSRVHELEVAPEDRAHYSKRTIDFEFDFPFGRKELCGLAYRTDFDLKNHSTASGVDLSYYDEESKERFIPHVIEPTFGLDRIVLALLCQSYTEDELGGEGEKRVYLKLPTVIAPVRVAVFPLLKNKAQLVDKAREIFNLIRRTVPNAVFDDNGNIGKCYRRQDEIGTPHCVTIDFDTIEKDAGVTVRNRDTGEQKRVAISELSDALQ